MGNIMMRLLLLAAIATVTVAMPVTGVLKTCKHNLDVTDIKCYDACLKGFFPNFEMSGFTQHGECPGKYNTAVNVTEEKICTDGVTNIKYCSGHGKEVVSVTVSEKVPAAMVLGEWLLQNNESAAEAVWPFDTCLHDEDKVDHKCSEACARTFRSFKMKGFSKGACPKQYKTVLNKGPETICSDGKSNLKDCEKAGAHTLTVEVKAKQA